MGSNGTGRRNARNRPSPAMRGIKVGALVFGVSVALQYASHQAMSSLGAVPAMLILLSIVAVGIAFDVLAVAITAADEGPFNAMAAKRLPGARHGLWLVRNADRVASFAGDIVGDIAGTVSGAAAATISFSVAEALGASVTLAGMLAVGVAASLTVGGKAAAKSVAIRDADHITLLAGRALHWLERAAGHTLVRDRTTRKPRRRSP